MMTFEEVLPHLKSGQVCRRAGWESANLVVFRQNNNVVYPDVFPHMTSLPDTVKEFLKWKNADGIRYQNQVLMMNTTSGDAKNYIPDWEDIFAVDWMVVSK